MGCDVGGGGEKKEESASARKEVSGSYPRKAVKGVVAGRGVSCRGGVSRHWQSKWLIDKSRRHSTTPVLPALHADPATARASQDFLSNRSLIPRASTPREALSAPLALLALPAPEHWELLLPKQRVCRLSDSR